MFLEQKNNVLWGPSASIEILRSRAKIVAKIRDFFAKRNVIEVETPLLSHATITDPHIESIPAIFKRTREQTVFLQTSPEYAMKRLLAAGIGPIYQICKAFRQAEIGKLHNPEFTMLEWYRPGFNHHDLMDEMDVLIKDILHVPSTERLSYAKMFEKYLELDPHQASLNELFHCAEKNNIKIESDKLDRDAGLNLLLTHCIEPYLGNEYPVFVYDFPASQAALAKIRPENPPVASRFELYFKGIELANGFHELVDVTEQRKRFEADLLYRKQNSLAPIAMDERFLAALEQGLPDCAGVAMGIDRLVMLALGCDSVAEIISFSFARA